MKFNIQGEEILIKFYHENKNDIKGTDCYIKYQDKEFKGHTILSPFDNFCKSIGRKLSLKKAMKNTSYDYILTKDFRTEIWKEYFKLHKL